MIPFPTDLDVYFDKNPTGEKFEVKTVRDFGYTIGRFTAATISDETNAAPPSLSVVAYTATKDGAGWVGHLFDHTSPHLT